MEIIISAVALVVSIASFGWSWWVHDKSLKRERQQATLDAYNLLQEQALDKLNCYTKSRVAEISKDEHSPEYKELSTLLARCDHFAVGVNLKIYDINTVRRLGKRYIIGIFKNLFPLIEKKRQINKTAKHYKEFEEMVENL